MKKYYLRQGNTGQDKTRHKTQDKTEQEKTREDKTRQIEKTLAKTGQH